LQFAIPEFHRQVQKLIGLHGRFFTFLHGMSSICPDSVPAILNQGESTALSFKTRIADFMGVPTGIKLGLLRRANENLTEIFGSSST